MKNKRFFALLMGLAFFGNSVASTTVLAATVDEESPPIISLEKIPLQYTDIYLSGVKGIELSYGEEFETSLPIFDPMTDVDFTSLDAFNNNNVDLTRSSYTVDFYLSDNPYEGVEMDPTAIYEKPWEETVAPIDMTRLGHYQLSYNFYDSLDNYLATEKVIISVIDPVAPQISYLLDEKGVPVVATAEYGTPVDITDIKNQWGLTIKDNRLGEINEEEIIDFSSIIDADGNYSTTGLHSIQIPSKSWMLDYRELNPHEVAEFLPMELWVNVEPPLNIDSHFIETFPVVIKEGDSYSYDMHEAFAFETTTSEKHPVEIVLSPLNPVEGKINKAGKYPISFTYTDPDGNMIEATTTLTVLSYPKLTGEDIKTYVGDPFDVNDFKIVVTDLENANIDFQYDMSDIPIFEGNYSMPGEYLLHVNALDEDEMNTSKDLKVTVLESLIEEPEVAIPPPAAEPTTPEEPINSPIIPLLPEEPVLTDSKPVITGYDVTVEFGSIWTSSTNGIKVVDAEDGILSFEIEKDLPLDKDSKITKFGAYPLIIKAVDSDGNKIEKTLYVTVKYNSALDTQNNVDASTGENQNEDNLSTGNNNTSSGEILGSEEDLNYKSSESLGSDESGGESAEEIYQYGETMDITILLVISVLTTLVGVALSLDKNKRK